MTIPKIITTMAVPFYSALFADGLQRIKSLVCMN